MSVLPLNSQDLDLAVPDVEKPIRTDGVIQSQEWDDAQIVPLSGGKGVYIMGDDDYLYIAVQGNKGGFSSLCLNIGERVRVLHSSTKLITAEYQKDGDQWMLTTPFASLEKTVRSQPVDESEQLKRFGWTGNVVDQGPPDQTEIKISKRSLAPGPLKISVVFFQFRAEQQLALMPSTLNDGSLNRELIMGGDMQTLDFDTESWLRISQ